MADQDLALEFVAQCRLGDLLQRNRRDIVGLVGVEIEVEPVLDRMREHAVEQFLEVRHHVGDGAEHALRRGDAPGQRLRTSPKSRAPRCRTGRPPAVRCGRASARASPRTPARRSPPAARPSRDGCAAPWCRARRRSAARNPCAARHRRRSSARRDRRRRRSSAPMKEPSGLGLRGQIWPLSIWVWQSTKAGSTMRPARSMARGGSGCSPRAAMPVILPSATAMSASAKPSASKVAARPGVSERCSAGIGEHVRSRCRE